MVGASFGGKEAYLREVFHSLKVGASDRLAAVGLEDGKIELQDNHAALLGQEVGTVLIVDDAAKMAHHALSRIASERGRLRGHARDFYELMRRDNGHLPAAALKGEYLRVAQEQITAMRAERALSDFMSSLRASTDSY